MCNARVRFVADAWQAAGKAAGKLLCPMGGDATSKIHSPVKKVMSPLDPHRRAFVTDAGSTCSDNVNGRPATETSDNVNRAPQC